MKKILREPLVHFAALGALLFVVFEGLNSEPSDAYSPSQISVTAQDVDALTQTFQATWRRPPTAQERDALVQDFIRQEVLVREAETLGMDRNDTIIRQRLQQKMEFLLSSSANAIEADDDALNAYLAENAEAFEVPVQTAFSQVYLGSEPSDEEIARALEQLQSGGDPDGVGQLTLLPRAMPLGPAMAINGVYGSGFSEQLAPLPPGEWAGPVRSGYGLHLVLVQERRPAWVPALQEIHERVEAEWRAVRAEEISEQLYAELRRRYDIEIEAPAE